MICMVNENAGLNGGLKQGISHESYATVIKKLPIVR